MQRAFLTDAFAAISEILSNPFQANAYDMWPSAKPTKWDQRIPDLKGALARYTRLGAQKLNASRECAQSESGFSSKRAKLNTI